MAQHRVEVWGGFPSVFFTERKWFVEMDFGSACHNQIRGIADTRPFCDKAPYPHLAKTIFQFFFPRKYPAKPAPNGFSILERVTHARNFTDSRKFSPTGSGPQRGRKIISSSRAPTPDTSPAEGFCLAFRSATFSRLRRVVARAPLKQGRSFSRLMARQFFPLQPRDGPCTRSGGRINQGRPLHQSKPFSPDRRKSGEESKRRRKSAPLRPLFPRVIAHRVTTACGQSFAAVRNGHRRMNSGIFALS